MVEELKDQYHDIKDVIKERIAEFKSINENERYFEEMAFCIFTPQSKAKNCWDTVEELREEGLLKKGTREEIADQINMVRFRNRKAEYLVEAREKFGCDGKALKQKLETFEDGREAREWLVNNVKGLGYKESSHFLRNVGMGDDIAILDRHIIRNLNRYDVIDEEPSTLTPKRYLEIEKKMKDFSDEIGIPLDHLDLLLWYKEAGEVFK